LTRYLEDFEVGQHIPLSSYLVPESEIVEFARQFDPQTFHTDPEHTTTQALGGLMASGWHTAAIFMRMIVDAYLADSAVLTSPGVDELRWLSPVRPGDVLSGDATVEEVRPSKSKPDRGLLITRVRLHNQKGESVFSVKAMAFVLRRPITESL